MTRAMLIRMNKPARFAAESAPISPRIYSSGASIEYLSVQALLRRLLFVAAIEAETCAIEKLIRFNQHTSDRSGCTWQRSFFVGFQQYLFGNVKTTLLLLGCCLKGLGIHSHNPFVFLTHKCVSPMIFVPLELRLEQRER